MSKKQFNRVQLRELEKLAALSDSEIDTTDIPEVPAENWIHARRSELYKPLKQPVTIRLDADIIAWFKDHAPEGGYQTEINKILRRHVTAAEKRHG